VLKSYLAIISVVFVLVLPSLAVAEEEGAHAQDERDEWSDFEDDLTEREQFILRQFEPFQLDEAQHQAYLEEIDPQGMNYCQDFPTMDALAITSFVSHGVPTWQTLWRASDVDSAGNRPDFVPQVIALAEFCDYTRGAVFRSAFVLEYLYWNRKVDRVGMEVADALVFRDYFYELKFIRTAHEKIAMARGQGPEESRIKTDFFEAEEMRLAIFLRIFGNVTAIIPPSRRRAYMAMVDILDIRRSSMIMFGSDILEIVDDSDDLQVMIQFYDYLVELQSNHQLLGEPHGGWNKLMEITAGDEEQGIRVLGLLAHLRVWILEEISEALISRDSLTPEMLRAFYAGANAYFLMNQLDERSAHDGDDPYSLDYHFFFPPGYTSSDWKTYHWYANAHIGCRLAKKGHNKASAELATRRLAQAYEALTLNLAIPTKRAMNEEPRARAIIEGWEDVDMNAEGGEHGWKICAL
jgi:hypothetical protein